MKRFMAHKLIHTCVSNPDALLLIMNTQLMPLPRAARLAAACVALGALAHPIIAADTNTIAKGAPEKAAPLEKLDPEPGKYSNWFDLSAGGSFVNGDTAAFQQRHQLPRGAFGGVEDFHWEKELPNKSTLKIDGRGIFDNHDYRLKFDLDFPDRGYIRFGYKEFRTYYDGSGGFFPATGVFGDNLALAPHKFNDNLAVDRGEVWFETGLVMPGKPNVAFRYSHQFRDGQKGSTEWGQTTQGALGQRGIVPTFLDLDETRDVFALDAKHTLGKTDFGAGVRYEVSDNDDSRNFRRQPLETADRFVTDREEIKTDMFSTHAFSETRLTEQLLFTSGLAYTTLDADLSGQRVYGTDYEAVYDPNLRTGRVNDEGFLALNGGSQMKQYLLNLNLMYMPLESLQLIPSIRVEKEDLNGESTFLETNFASPGTALPPLLQNLESDRSFVDVSESLELRYTGLTNWVFYTSGFWLEGQGNLREEGNALPTGAGAFRDTEDNRFTQKYTIGAAWYPLTRLNIAGQYYHKIRDNAFDHEKNFSPKDYPAFLDRQNFETDDMNVRVTWRPCATVTLVSRYDFQLSTIDNRGFSLEEQQSAEITSHIFGETVTWSPLARLYLQGGVNYVLDQTDTPAQDLIGTLVHNSKNDYWNGTFTAGFALDKKTDLQGSYFYYRANDFQDAITLSQPYGTSLEEHAITGGITRRLRENLLLTLKYGYINNRDVTSGGNNNYEAHLVYSTLRCYF